MKNALVLHGTEDSPNSNWFEWLEVELTKRGYKVWLPKLPESETPNMREYVSFLMNNDFNYNSETIIIGHSSGAVAIFGLLSKIKTKINSAYLVSAFKDNLDWDALDGLFEEPFNFAEIQDKAEKIILIHSDTDPYGPLEDAKYLSEQVNGKLVVLKGQGHFNTGSNPKYTKFPELLELITQD